MSKREDIWAGFCVIFRSHVESTVHLLTRLDKASAEDLFSLCLAGIEANVLGFPKDNKTDVAGLTLLLLQNVTISVTPSQPLLGHFTKSTNKNVTRLLSQWRCTISQQETVPDICQPNDWRKRWDLVSRRNLSIEEAALVCGGRLFHARAAATGNARSPRVDRRVDGTSGMGLHCAGFELAGMWLYLTFRDH